MNKLILLTTIVILLATGAQAQETKTKRWRAQLGIGLPTAASGKSFVGTTPQSGGISYDLGHVGNGTWGLYSDGVMRVRERDNAAGGGTTMTSQGVLGEVMEGVASVYANPGPSQQLRLVTRNLGAYFMTRLGRGG